MAGTHCSLNATLGVEPQVVTITLDHLLKDGEKIDEVVVIYTDTKRVLDALSVVQKEF